MSAARAREPLRRNSLERRSAIDPAEFQREFATGEGRPVLIEDASATWPARSAWTFENLKARYGTDFVSVSLGIGSEFGKTTRLSEYLDYLDEPAAGLKGFWVGTKDGKPLRAPPPSDDRLHYLLDWSAYSRHPEMAADVLPTPYFIPDWEALLDPSLRALLEWANARRYSSVYIGPAGTYSPLHQDFGDSYTCLTQIQGRKEVCLFPPGSGLEELGSDLTVPYDENPALHGAHLFEGVIQPGETLFIPPNWWHSVRALEKSITVSHNFFNGGNFNAHLTGVIRNLPRMLEGLERFPEWRRALGIDWDPSRPR